jgi:hypothetical protein
MESSGEAGKVNISEHTYELVKDFFICEHRGRMPVKYKGEIDMYFVKSIRMELSDDGIVPNRDFFIKLQLLRIYDIENFILQKLRSELPDGMYFHNAAYTDEIFVQSELLSIAERLSNEEMLFVRTAALFLNIGYVTSFDNSVEECTNYAAKLLPKFMYTPKQSELIIGLIKTVNTNTEDPDRLAQVLLDACHSYLGREDFIQLSLNHFNEAKIHKNANTIKEWFNLQTKMLQQTPLYTESARLLCEISVTDQVEKIKDFLKNR